MTAIAHDRFQAYLEAHREFLILSHVDPDADAIGSCLALARAIRGMGKGATVVNDSPLPDSLRFLPDANQVLRPSDVHGRTFDAAFVLDGPGEYEVKEVLVTGVRTYRDDAKGEEHGKQTSFVIEVDGVHTMHLGDIGHLLSEEKLADVGSIDIACVPLGGYLSPTRAAALIAQLDPHIVVPMPMCDDDADCAEALQKFFHEMGTEPVVQPKLSVTTSSLPAETTTVLLESRGKQA